jgi:entericidin A
MKRNVILAMLLGATLMLNACATVKGAGKDIQSAGEAGEEAINK